MSVRVRFAPSPTGYLHIGGARTALFNWLFARKHEGIFVLRIEDTDLERSSDEMVEGILEGLQWLGLDWDEGPYYQSQRLHLYRQAAEDVRKRGHAYFCFCSAPQPRSEENAPRPEASAWRCQSGCPELPESEVRARLEGGERAALRFRVPRDGRLAFKDRVYDLVEVETATLEDFVLLRSDGLPTYHLAVVADDVDMGITHVIRGADHLTNTFKHLLLYQALGQPQPVWAHLPLILGPDKKRLSKRHGATSVLEYRSMGFLPAALRNYLALLGWNPGTDQELFEDRDLIDQFDLERINKANAVFDLQKLEWMNGKYLSEAAPEELASEAKALLAARGIRDPAWDGSRRERFLAALDLLKTRMRRLTELADTWKAFFTDEFDYEEEAVQKFLEGGREARPELSAALSELREAYGRLEPFDLETVERVLREVAARHGLKAGVLMGAVRVALTGRTAAPGLFDIVVTLGKEATLRRLQRFLDFLGLSR